MTISNIEAARAANDAAIRALFNDAAKGRVAIAEAGVMLADGFVSGWYGTDAKKAAAEVYAMRPDAATETGSLASQVSKFANFTLVAAMWNNGGLNVVQRAVALVDADYKASVGLLRKVKSAYKGKSEQPTDEDLTGLLTDKPKKIEPTVRDTADDAVDALAELLEATKSHPAVFAAWKSVSELAKTLGETGAELAERAKRDAADAAILAKHAPADGE